MKEPQAKEYKRLPEAEKGKEMGPPFRVSKSNQNSEKQ